jgi:hypothetical protein
MSQKFPRFGSDHDSYDATDELGQLRSWLFHDRRLLSEALELSEELREDGTIPPWLEGSMGKRFVVPGRSLHWSYGRLGITWSWSCLTMTCS